MADSGATVSDLVQQLKTARGKRYYDILSDIAVGPVGDKLEAAFNEYQDADGKLTVLQMGILALRFDLNMKATYEIMNKRGRVPTGAYDRLFGERRKQLDGTPFTVSYVFAKAREALEAGEAQP